MQPQKNKKIETSSQVKKPKTLIEIQENEDLEVDEGLQQAPPPPTRVMDKY